MHYSLFLPLTRRKFIAGAVLLMGVNQTRESKEVIDIVQSKTFLTIRLKPSQLKYM